VPAGRPETVAPTLHPWWARLSGPHGHTLVAVLSGDFRPGTVVDLPGERRPSGWRLAVDVRTDGSVCSVQVAAQGAPLLWYVELTEPGGDEPATTLVAFSDARCADGTVLDAGTARASGVSAAEQVGAVRWWTGSGLVHQVYVQPAARERGVGAKLVQAAYGLQAARGLPEVHGDGRRTDLGEQWRGSLPEEIAVRMAPWSQRMAPMTPGG
jgi:GNAT superfamily N-acetyltransferase